MRKIRLKIDELVVESMDTVAVPPRGGTVRGMVSGGECDTLALVQTCGFYGSCDVGADCDGTAVNDTCRVEGCWG
jgi:hypothetical protein